MRSYIYLWVSLVALLLAAVPTHAQSNPPFSNPSLDSNCYFPQIGAPGEIDTIYGNAADTIGNFIYGSGLGAYIHNLGPTQGGMPGNMLLSNQAYIKGEITEYETPTGASFNLHNQKKRAQDLPISWQQARFGHFHDRTHLDVFDDVNWIIYWADDSGNYESDRHTVLQSNIRGSYGISHGDMGMLNRAYIAPLRSDTLDDLVLGFETLDSIRSNDVTCLALFLGSKLHNLDTAFEDTSIIGPNVFPNSGQVSHYVQQGNFRKDRQDLIVADDSLNLFYFKNDPPFTLTKLFNAMYYDTLWTKPTRWKRSDLGTYWINPNKSIGMNALPKMAGDNSIDWVIWIPTEDSGDGIFIFRGGPDFGSHRITIDSAAYVINSPNLGESSWPDFFSDAGDMTGTGNQLLYVAGDDGAVAYQNFYLTGQALDKKIDIYNTFSAGALVDTLTANDDRLEDLLMGLPGYTSANDISNGLKGIGSVWLLYGSKNIPVHLNPQFADARNIPQIDGAGITFAPNPVTRSWSVATVVWPEAEDAQYEVYNILGSQVQQGVIRMLGGTEQERIYFPNLPDGTYVFVIHGQSHEAQTKLTVLR